MSPQTGATATTTPAKAPRRRRGEGQWALGYREPLNKNEENKKNDDGLNVRQRIIDIYSKQGFDSIDPADLRGRMRWYGLYTQRRARAAAGQEAARRPRGAASPTGRTSSCTGSRSSRSRRSGRPWRRSACPPPRPAATRPG